jgi:hypothetical protein
LWLSVVLIGAGAMCIATAARAARRRS